MSQTQECVAVDGCCRDQEGRCLLHIWWPKAATRHSLHSQPLHTEQDHRWSGERAGTTRHLMVLHYLQIWGALVNYSTYRTRRDRPSLYSFLHTTLGAAVTPSWSRVVTTSDDSAENKPPDESEMGTTATLEYSLSTSWKLCPDHVQLASHTQWF